MLLKMNGDNYYLNVGQDSDKVENLKSNNEYTNVENTSEDIMQNFENAMGCANGEVPEILTKDKVATTYNGDAVSFSKWSATQSISEKMSGYKFHGDVDVECDKDSRPPSPGSAHYAATDISIHSDAQKVIDITERFKK